jgi:hypothetical protein
LKDEVKAIGDGVDKANQTLATMAAREQSVQDQIATDPVSIGLLDLQSIGQPVRSGAGWPAKLAVYLNASGYDFNMVQLRMSTGGTDGKRRTENHSSDLGAGSGPGAVQIMVTLPPDARWATACLHLPASANAAGRTLLQRWRLIAQADQLKIETDGRPQLRSADEDVCSESTPG